MSQLLISNYIHEIESPIQHGGSANKEHVIDLLRRVTTVSVETQRIVAAMVALP